MKTKTTRPSLAICSLLLCLMATPAVAGETPAPDGAEAYFVNLSDGDTLTGPVLVIFGLRAMGVAPAGTEKAATGHHHLLIDAPELSGDELDEPIISDDQHKHFGGGQTETTIELTPGSHTLQIVLGDHNHIPHNPIVASQTITITVTE